MDSRIKPSGSAGGLEFLHYSSGGGLGKGAITYYYSRTPAIPPWPYPPLRAVSLLPPPHLKRTSRPGECYGVGVAGPPRVGGVVGRKWNVRMILLKMASWNSKVSAEVSPMMPKTVLP